MVPLKFIADDPEPFEAEGFQSQLTPGFGMNLGMVIRRGMGKMWSLESGINFVQRNYALAITHPDLPEATSMDFRFIGYEIPLQAMVYVKLSNELYMNASGGVSLDMYPSNVESFASARQDSIVFDYYQQTVRNGWLQFALLANYGFEYRTKDKGFYYLGISYHRPFNIIGGTFITVERNRDPARLEHFIKGDYLTLDLRYFFHEKPKKNVNRSY